MDIITVRAFFMWCSIINGALLILSFLICAFAGDLVYRTHSKLFPMSREVFNVAGQTHLNYCDWPVFADVSYVRLNNHIGGQGWQSRSLSISQNFPTHG
jgi:hypothetical protein